MSKLAFYQNSECNQEIIKDLEPAKTKTYAALFRKLEKAAPLLKSLQVLKEQYEPIASGRLDNREWEDFASSMYLGVRFYLDMYRNFIDQFKKICWTLGIRKLRDDDGKMIRTEVLVLQKTDPTLLEYRKRMLDPESRATFANDMDKLHFDSASQKAFANCQELTRRFIEAYFRENEIKQVRRDRQMWQSELLPQHCAGLVSTTGPSVFRRPMKVGDDALACFVSLVNSRQEINQSAK